MPKDFEKESIIGNLVKSGDLVLLVMPQDIQAPKGRLILPQVQVLRELLDKKCQSLCVQYLHLRERDYSILQLRYLNHLINFLFFLHYLYNILKILD